MFSEIEAWRRLTGCRPTAWDIETIKLLDRAYMTRITERAKKNQPPPKGKKKRG